MRIGSARQPGTVAMSGGGAAEAVTDPSDPSDGRDWPYRPPQRLLLASDGSPQSLRAARWLARLCLALS